MQKYCRKLTTVMAERNDTNAVVTKTFDCASVGEVIVTIPPKHWAVEMENGYISLLSDDEFNSSFENVPFEPLNLAQKL